MVEQLVRSNLSIVDERMHQVMAVLYANVTLEEALKPKEEKTESKPGRALNGIKLLLPGMKPVHCELHWCTDIRPKNWANGLTQGGARRLTLSWAVILRAFSHPRWICCIWHFLIGVYPYPSVAKFLRAITSLAAQSAESIRVRCGDRPKNPPGPP